MVWSGAAGGAALGELVPFCVCDLCELGEWGPGFGFEKVWFLGEGGAFWLVGAGFVEGADLLADVASEGPSVEVFVEGVLVFDGEVADAAAGIDLPAIVIEDDRAGGAGIDALGAGSAAAFCRLVWFQLGRGEEDAEKKPASAPAIDEAGVLSEPADAGELGEIAFHDRGGIDAGAGFGGWFVLFDEGF